MTWYFSNFFSKCLSAAGGKIKMNVFMIPPGAEVVFDDYLAFRRGRKCFTTCFDLSARGGKVTMILFAFPPGAEV